MSFNEPHEVPSEDWVRCPRCLMHARVEPWAAGAIKDIERCAPCGRQHVSRTNHIAASETRGRMMVSVIYIAPEWRDTWMSVKRPKLLTDTPDSRTKEQHHD